MNVMRFVGRTSREAMRKLRDTLGPDALVLANRPCAEGVELLAAAPDALAPIGDEGGAPQRPAPAEGRAAGGARRATPAPAEVAVPAGMSTVSFQDYVRQRLRDRNRAQLGEPAALGTGALAAGARAATAQAPAEPVAPFAPVESVASVASARPAAAAAVRGPAAPRAGGPGGGVAHERVAPIAPPKAAFVPPGGPAAGLAAAGLHVPAPLDAAPRDDAWSMPAASSRAAAGSGQDALVAELQSLKGMISRQFATISWFEGVRRSPVQGKLLRTMVAAGFSLKLARSVVTRLPSDYGERDAQVWLEEVLARNLRCAPPGEAFEAGGVFALVGPTGVGKTTTTAKIAARHVLKHGAQSVALITVDTYRLGAHDQLRAFGRILGVPVHIAHDASALHDLLRLRGSRQLVLVDTVGLGHRDERIRSLLMSLPRTDIRHVVVASSAAQAETIDESLRAYEARQAAGVVLTKVDEAARIGGALDCLLRQRLRLLGVCDGQRVPEDWQAPDAPKLVRRALLAPHGGAFALDDEELPLVFGVAATLQGDVAHA
jgi:flagellar biosynthesis protein FlhF